MSDLAYKPIKDAIVSKLQTVESLDVVYAKEEKILGSFPAATVSAKSHEGQFEDTVSNLKTYEHFIRLYFRTDENNDADYEDVLETVADSVIYALEHDITLGGVVDWAMPTSGIWKFGQKEVPVRYLEITFTSKARVVR